MRTIRLLLLTLLILAIPAISFAQFAVSIEIAPPALPVYTQPMPPGDGYLWTPGYWAYGDEGYFWVPGTWVQPPEVGYLWTPGYWAWGDNGYAWNDGYWGTQVGFYGGVNYGFGYGGGGYEGGYWDHGSFYYNRRGNKLNGGNFHNVYDRNVRNTNNNHVSYNGGSGGISARPTQAETAASREQHRPVTTEQTQHVQAARSNHALLASVNQGRPAVAATAKPGELSGRGVVAAKAAGAPYKAADNRAAAPSTANTQSSPQQRQSQPQGMSRSQPAPQQHQSAPQQRQSQPQGMSRSQPSPQQHQSAPQQRQSQPQVMYRSQRSPQQHQSAPQQRQ